MRIVSPRSSTQLEYYDRPAPVFHAFGIEQQIGLMLERTVPLPSGGSLVIDETEALVAIDVNSGKMRSHGDAETTA
jgi:ribonuclease E